MANVPSFGALVPASTSEGPLTQQSARTITVVDNDPEICSMLKLSFEETRSYHVAAFEAGADAIAHLDKSPSSLALIDVLLSPPVSGIAVAERANALGIPVLLMSGHPDYVTRRRPLAFPLIAKPFRVSALIAKADLLIAGAARLHLERARRMAAGRAIVDNAALASESWSVAWRRFCDRVLGGE